jgi:hypothetical protein
VSLEALVIAVVAAEDAEKREAGVVKWIEGEWGAVVAGVHHQSRPTVGEKLDEVANCRKAVVRVGYQSNAHQAGLHAGSSLSFLTRSR